VFACLRVHACVYVCISVCSPLWFHVRSCMCEIERDCVCAYVCVNIFGFLCVYAFVLHMLCV